MVVKISALLPSWQNIDTGNGQLAVRSIDLKGIVELFTRYKPAVTDIIAKAKAGDSSIAELIVNHAPMLGASIIAKGANAEGQEDDIIQLPGAVQLIAIAEIWRASVPDVKKLIDSLSAVSEQLQAQMPNAAATVKKELQK